MAKEFNNYGRGWHLSHFGSVEKVYTNNKRYWDCWFFFKEGKYYLVDSKDWVNQISAHEVPLDLAHMVIK